MRSADDPTAVPGKKTVRLPVEWMANVHAKILVGEEIVSLSHYETTQRPVTVPDAELTAARVVDLVDSSDCYRNYFGRFQVGPLPNASCGSVQPR